MVADRAHGDHAVGDVVPALLGFRSVRPRVELAGPLDRCGEHRALGRGQLGDRLGEVGARRGGDAVGVASVVDGVEVGLEDLVLRPLIGHLRRDHQLLALTDQAALVADHGLLHVLLGDGGTTTGVVTGELTDRGASETGDRESGVVVEVAVLGGEDRIADLFGDLVDVDVLPVALRWDDPGQLGGAVVGVDLGDLVGHQLFRLRNLRDGVCGEERHQWHDDEHREHGDGGRDEAPPHGLALPGPLALGAVGCCGRVVSHLAGLSAGLSVVNNLCSLMFTDVRGGPYLPGTCLPGAGGSIRTAGTPRRCGQSAP